MPRQTELIQTLEVAAGILISSDDRILVAERVGGGPFQGMWEFPGGKLKDEEPAADALVRELEEELGIEATDFAPFMRLQHTYPDRRVDLHFFTVTRWQGTAQSLERQALRWVSRAQLSDLELLPADRPVIEALQKPQVFFS